MKRIYSKKDLRKLVDVVWMTCTESEEVPSTAWADWMIKKWKKELKTPQE